MYKRKGLLFILSAPSGTGKTSISANVIKAMKGIRHSISYTTRPMRPNERDGIDYHFISADKFKKMTDNHEFLEWARVHNNLYGTSLESIGEAEKSGYDLILTIDVQGACQLKRKTDKGVYIFILPPSIDTLKERLIKRSANTNKEIEERLTEAKNEIDAMKEFDYVVINDDFEKASLDIISIITAERLRMSNIKSIEI